MRAMAAAGRPHTSGRACCRPGLASCVLGQWAGLDAHFPRDAQLCKQRVFEHKARCDDGWIRHSPETMAPCIQTINACFKRAHYASTHPNGDNSSAGTKLATIMPATPCSNCDGCERGPNSTPGGSPPTIGKSPPPQLHGARHRPPTESRHTVVPIDSTLPLAAAASLCSR